MNDLTYQLVIDKASKRHVDILLLLLESKKPISIPTLMHYCNVSRKTIKKDFDNFKQTFPTSIQFIEDNDTTAIELIDNPDAIEDYLDALVVNNPLYTVIEKSFFSESETVESLADELYIVESTLRRYLNHLKKVLKEYKLSLKLNPIEIVGDEINIRYFYFSYFDQPARAGLLKISPKQETALYETIQSWSNKYDNILNLEFHRLVNWLVIFENRLSKKKHVHFNDEVYLTYSKDSALLMMGSAVKETLRDQTLTHFNQHEMLFSYLTIFDSIIYGQTKYFLINDFFDRLQPYEELTTIFFRASRLDFGGHMDLKILLQSFLANLAALTDLTPLFQKNETQLKRLVENKYPYMLSQWVSLLTNYSSFEYVYDVAASLTILTMSNMKKNKRILLSLSGSPAAVNYYKMMIEKTLPLDTELIWNPDQPLDNSLAEKFKVDICICNFKPSELITYCQTFRVSRIPLEIELDMLLRQLNKV